VRRGAVSAGPIRVVRAAAGDEPTLRDARLRALTDAPDAFGSTIERERGRTDEDWRRWLSPGATFIAYDGDEAVGLVAGAADPEDATIVHLMAMWVAPSHRASGAADALIAALMSWAADEHAREVRLQVVDTNARARRCYERNGFRANGREQVRDRDAAIQVGMSRPVSGNQPTRTSV
jgi:GNAT superfamily N-acetyltransferase